MRRVRPSIYESRSDKPVDEAAVRRRLLALRASCRRHGSYAANILVRGVVVASGCPGCGRVPR